MANFDISVDELIYPRLSLDHHLQILRSIWEYPTYARFAQVRCPVLMVPASPPGPLDADDLTHLELKQQGITEAQARIGDLHVHWMEDTIHDIPLQRPTELAGLIVDFCARLP